MASGESADRPVRARWAARPLLTALLAMIALAAGACGGSAPRPPEPLPRPAAGPTAAPTRCDPAREARPGAGPGVLRQAGVDRPYLLALPAGYDGRTAYPLVVNLHGFASDQETMEATTAMGHKGTARGYIVVTPDALGSPRQWNIFSAADQADDFGFARALLDDLNRRLCLDPLRIYVAGHSNGSAFAALLACRAPYLVAAVAMVSATTPSGCPAGVTPATLAIAGTADPQVPYAGGTIANSAIRLPAAPEVIQATARKYGCRPDPVEDTPTPGVRRTHYSGCPDGADVVLDTVLGGRHPWPGGSAAGREPGNSAAGRTFDATAAILDFFDAHRSRTPTLRALGQTATP